MTALREAFEKENYTEIPFSFNGLGHPTIHLKLKNYDVCFLLDTGASINLLDVEFAKEIGLALTETGETGGGAGGLTHDIYSIGPTTLEYKDLTFSFDEFFAMNFDTIKHALTSRGVTEEFNGILGFGFLKKTNSFIDYSGDRIYVRP